jgi:exosortase
MDSSSAADAAALKRPPGFLEELRDVLAQLQSKEVLVALVAAWTLLFYYLGNSILAYTQSYSLFQWCYSAYNAVESEDSHGNLIPFAVLALLWWKRAELLALPQRVWPAGLVLLAGTSLLHFVGYVLQIPHISVIAYVSGLYAILGICFGPAWLKATSFPMILLVFCVPLGPVVEPLTFPLRVFSTGITHFICHTILGINVIRQGTQLIDPAGKFDYDVAAACSGIRSLISLSALTVVYGMVFLKAWWKRWVVILSAVPLALTCNILRLVSVVFASDIFGPAAGHFVHEWFGFLTYAIALGCVMILSSVLGESRQKGTAS